MPDDAAVNAARELGDKVDRLAVQVAALDKSFKDNSRRTGRKITAIVAACALTLVLLFAVYFTGRYSANQAACVRQWANAYAGRTTALYPASTARTDALDALIRSLPASQGQTPAEAKATFQAALLGYLKASDNYSKAADQNPPPLAPSYRC